MKTMKLGGVWDRDVWIGVSPLGRRYLVIAPSSKVAELFHSVIDFNRPIATSRNITGCQIYNSKFMITEIDTTAGNEAIIPGELHAGCVGTNSLLRQSRSSFAHILLSGKGEFSVYCESNQKEELDRIVADDPFSPCLSSMESEGEIRWTSTPSKPNTLICKLDSACKPALDMDIARRWQYALPVSIKGLKTKPLKMICVNGLPDTPPFTLKRKDLNSETLECDYFFALKGSVIEGETITQAQFHESNNQTLSGEFYALSLLA